MVKKSKIFWHQLIKDRWVLHKSPGRPSKGDIKIYEQFLKKVPKRQKILILGATPELRDLAHKHKAEVAIIDVSLEMMIVMKEFMKYKDKAKDEIWVGANWLKNPLTSNYFDVVLGDYVSSNVPLDFHLKFFQEINRVLRKNSYFITRTTHTPEKPILPAKIVEKYLKMGDITLKGKNLITELEQELMLSFIRKPSYEMSSGKAIGFFEKYIKKQKKEKILNQILKDLKFQFPPKTWWCPPKEIYQKRVKKYFKIINFKKAKDYYCSVYSTIYLLKKK